VDEDNLLADTRTNLLKLYAFHECGSYQEMIALEGKRVTKKRLFRVGRGMVEIALGRLNLSRAVQCGKCNLGITRCASCRAYLGKASLQGETLLDLQDDF
jgi:hypothetical protein